MQEPKCYTRTSITTWACRDVNELYENVSKVGQGTYGEVNKARLRTNLDQIVALKKIKDVSETEGFPITALREINILQQCDHPNIVKLYDVVVSKAFDSDNKKKKGSTYLVFEYMEHELLGFLANCTLSVAQVKCIMKQILQGLEYLHNKNIIHRDIKNANILINNKGEVKIADFGLAKRIDPLSGKLTQRVVTRWYRAPELLLGSRKYTTLIDVWALGCVFAELLVGKTSPLFPAQKSPDQFEVICEKCGTPDESQWPGFKSMPAYANMIPRKNYPRTLMQYMRKQKSNIDSLGLDLLDKMLTLNPDDRISATEALEHQYFKTEPFPCDLTEMPKIEKECHVFVLSGQMNKEIKAKNQSNNQNQPSNHHGRPPHQNNYNNHGHNNYHNNNRNYSKNYNNNGNYNSHRHNDNRNYKSYGNGPSNASDKDKERDRDRDREKDRERDREREKEKDKNKADNPYSIISNTGGSKEPSLSSNLTSLFKSENLTNVMISQSLNVPKEAKNDTNKLKEQNKQNNDMSHDIEKPKRQENGQKGGIQPEETSHKRKTSHEIDSFEKISKKRQVDPIKQNS